MANMRVFTEKLSRNRETYAKLVDELCERFGFLHGDVKSPVQGFLVFNSESDELVAYILYQRKTTCTHIDRLFVAPDFRGKHLGSYLVQEVEKDCIFGEELLVCSQEKAITFWEHIGFKGVMQEYGFMSKIVQ